MTPVSAPTSARTMTAPMRFVQKLVSSVDGRGILTNIADCYTFILDHYKPGDRIVLFGFSRGAYTVRSVADLLRLCGVPTKAPDGELPRFRKRTRQIAEEAVLTVLEHGAGHPRGGELEAERDELSRRFREKYGSHHPSGEAQRSNVAPYFIGVFDTVASLGASGLRRVIIQSGLFMLYALGGLIVGVIPAALASILFASVWGIRWWITLLGTEAVAMGAAMLWLRSKQRREVKKTIEDFPNKGDKRSHYARWEGKNFNRLLSRFVVYGRSANAIDETRADFDRVKWGPTRQGVEQTAGFPTFKQYFFAGNHSDVGGSYTEVESRLSDIALAWMLEEAVQVPDGIRLGPVYVHGVKMEGTGDQGTALYLYPADDGVQHSEVAATRDALDALKPALLAWLFRNRNYVLNVREIPTDGTVHPSVHGRFDLAGVQQSDGFKPYRPEALRHVDAFKYGYEPEEKPADPADAAPVATS
jgi:hypothetical protein